MIIEGLKLALLGMSVVFLFLVLLVLIVHLSTSLLKSFTDKEAQLAAARLIRPLPVSDTAADDKKIMAVISAAIAAHRARMQSR